MKNRIIYFLPIIVTVFICLFFFFSLSNDTSKLSSPIIGKEVPEFSLVSLFENKDDPHQIQNLLEYSCCKSILMTRQVYFLFRSLLLLRGGTRRTYYISFRKKSRKIRRITSILKVKFAQWGAQRV